MDQVSQPVPLPYSKSIFKQWWLWLIIVAILIAVLFIPYISVPASCMPCPDTATNCPACPTYQQNLIEYWFT
ncbi:MAG: hypothetical protein HZC01_04190 [Candidatus Kerfeldbacteria bacterium]|nr:hypothetical protein [Candidatus Kerfeldbacteria bacterium]